MKPSIGMSVVALIVLGFTILHKIPSDVATMLFTYLITVRLAKGDA